jgi:hypothetical protein
MKAAVAALFGGWLLLMSVMPLGAQGTYEIDLEAIERKIARTVERPYSLGGSLEFQPFCSVSTATRRSIA